MVSEAPPFWWQPVDWKARALWPVSKAYGAVAAYRMKNAPRVRVDAPVLCIGNFTVGGTGKTPTAIALATHARTKGLRPGVISRGYGGQSGAPRLVNADGDDARHVGDEPLLIAAHAPVAVSPNRTAAANLLIGQGCDFLIMDDGLQSARIHVDYALAIVDCRHGLGNGMVIPAGPLRAPINTQLRYVSALLKMGSGEAADSLVRASARAAKPVFEASVRVANPEAVAGKRFLAFAGIGHPQRFFDSIAAAGGVVVEQRAFADHHFYAMDELVELDNLAHQEGLLLITTAKDAARLRHAETPPLFLSKLNVLEIETAFDDPTVPERIVRETIANWKNR